MYYIISQYKLKSNVGKTLENHTNMLMLYYIQSKHSIVPLNKMSNNRINIPPFLCRDILSPFLFHISINNYINL